MAFTCPRCGAVSHNPMDEREGYCGRCYDWTGGEVLRRPDSPVDLGEPPYPGSDAALDKGCLCPVLDNGHGNTGLARDRGGWIVVVGCPLHSPNAS